MLKQMHSLATHSSLTGALAAGAVDAVAQYNQILERLTELGIISGNLFRPLPDDATFDRLGVASTLLEGYLLEEGDGDRSSGNKHGNVIIGNIGGLDELKDLGRIIRDNLPDFIRKRAGEGAEEEASAPPPPPPPGGFAPPPGGFAPPPGGFAPPPPPPTPRRPDQDEEPIPMPDIAR